MGKIHHFCKNMLSDVNVYILERFSKDDATSKKTWKWRGYGVICPFMDVPTLYPRHFHVVFDVASSLLNLSIVMLSDVNILLCSGIIWENVVIFSDILPYSVIFRHVPWYSAIFRDVLAFRVFTTPDNYVWINVIILQRSCCSWLKFTLRTSGIKLFRTRRFNLVSIWP